MNSVKSVPANSIAMLRRLAQKRPAQESCELCNVPLAPTHRHLLEMATRKLVCACDGCALRFELVIGGRFKLVPRDPRLMAEFKLSDAQWESLALPINLAFFFRRTPENQVVAMYPSPAGATESLLPLGNWETIVAENPVLSGLDPDVEALLVNRIGHTRMYFIAPMDICFELAGLIRMRWRGLSGGDALWQEIHKFFTRLSGEASRVPPRPHAANALLCKPPRSPGASDATSA